jgi:hypothetical protein
MGIYRLFILNNYDNYVIFKFVTYAYDHKIIFLYLSAHFTHRLQSLDIGIFDSLATYYDQLVKERNQYKGRKVTKREYI